MTRLLLPACLLLLTAPATAAPADSEFLMGSVVKSDKWKMNRVNETEVFTGNVSFRNPHYLLKADHAVYNRARSAWDLDGSVYVLRTFDDSSQVEMTCAKGRYLETAEEAHLVRGGEQVKMTYRGHDGKILKGRSDRALAENKKRLMHFEGAFSVSTENLDMYSIRGLYDDALKTFLFYDSTGVPSGAILSPPAPRAPGASLPAAIGRRDPYNFAITAESMKFFRDSRDIKFYNRVYGWVKDMPPGTAAPVKTR
ncbi:MAG TPA: hypothetical protein DCZ92_10520 [Elusimicrobia bacterium]|nr:hypothetical protein [Elusimicrobiota bacterium]